jgi:hypothetical protein
MWTSIDRVTKIHLQAYFITNKEPIKYWEFVSLILEGLGYERYDFPNLEMME